MLQLDGDLYQEVAQFILANIKIFTAKLNLKRHCIQFLCNRADFIVFKETLCI